MSNTEAESRDRGHWPTDADLRALTLEERRELMARLTRLPGGRPRAHVDARKIRRHRVGLLTVGAVGLVPWTIYLGITLPGRYVVPNWTLTWVGFDVILTLMFVATAALAFRGRQLVVLASFASGVLLLCDAWFDITTAAPHDRPMAIGLAAFIEIPVAVFLIYASLRLLRWTFQALLVDRGGPLWRIPILVGERELP
ncbi:MAG: putative rane protein [Marmoricola sp.]|nr:putative rane protein [Marmoricola sp.]